MNRKVNIGRSIAAGLLGGVLSHYIVVDSARAQTQPVPSKEITAQRFVLTNDKGIPAGVFGFDKNGDASITLFDRSGKVIWSENGKPNPHALAENISK
jgi:hypothetical protein